MIKSFVSDTGRESDVQLHSGRDARLHSQTVVKCDISCFDTPVGFRKVLQEDRLYALAPREIALSLASKGKCN